MSTLHDLYTPALVLDGRVMTANIERMAARAEALGVALRPHGKTPKSAEIGRRLCARAAIGLTVSTLLEAERYFAEGVRDLFYAVPIAAHKVERAAALLRSGASLVCLADHIDAARQAADEAVRCAITLPLAVEIDVDNYRTGIASESHALLELAGFIAASPSLRFAGLMSYGGASYDVSIEETCGLTERHRRALLASRDLLAQSGIGCPMLSFGSTPAVLHAETLEGMTELRCGIYVFQDLFQAAIGACRIEDIALSVLCSVIGQRGDANRLVIDAGGLALSKDRSTAETDQDAGFGLICETETGALIDDLYVQSVSQELGLVTTRSGAAIAMDRFPIGSRLRILPNHADMTAAAYEKYHVVEGGVRIVDVWSRFNGW